MQKTFSVQIYSFQWTVSARIWSSWLGRIRNRTRIIIRIREKIRPFCHKNLNILLIHTYWKVVPLVADLIIFPQKSVIMLNMSSPAVLSMYTWLFILNRRLTSKYGTYTGITVNYLRSLVLPGTDPLCSETRFMISSSRCAPITMKRYVFECLFSFVKQNPST